MTDKSHRIPPNHNHRPNTTHQKTPAVKTLRVPLVIEKLSVPAHLPERLSNPQI
jgi:hypothetical protein